MKNTLGLVAGLAVAASASAQVTLVDFAFNSLQATYTSGSSTLVASATNGPIVSSGNVRRLVGPTGTANFDAGAAANALSLNLSVSAIGASSALGAGTLTLLDNNGDTITATVSGTFVNGVSAVFFNGFLSNVALNNISGDGQFNGASGGAFGLNLSSVGGPGPYTGAVVYLELGNASNFFQNSFASTVTQVSGNIIPAPASLALIGLAGGIAARRRRA